MADTNDNTSFHDEAPSDRNMYKYIQDMMKKKRLMKGVVADEVDSESDNYDSDADEDFDEDNDDDFVYRE